PFRARGVGGEELDAQRAGGGHGGGVDVEVDVEGGGGQRGVEDQRRVLQVVAAGVAVAGVVGRHAVAIEVDAQAAVVVDTVAENLVAGGAGADGDADAGVEGDEVRRGADAADGVAVGAG